MCTEVNSAMGLQATTATKRKHELTFESKDTNTYTNCPPPIKTGKWSLKNNNYIDAIEEQKVTVVNGFKFKNNNKNSCNVVNNNNINNNNNNNNENKSCDISCGTISYNLRNGKEVMRSKVTATKSALNSVITNSPVAAEVDASIPLPPTLTSIVPEDSIAKLEVVASVPWTSAPESVDCISKLQAVAVPCDPWGGITTRSTLATTLLSADELDDDDDDFEDDYEEEESIIPTYCPLRYHAFPSANSSSPPNSNHQNQRVLNSFASSSSYGSRPNYYSEPFPQQNCARTGGSQHLRVGNGFTWPNGSNNSFYSSSEGGYTCTQQQQQQQQAAPQQIQPQHQQQTIRCAENGKSYLELGCSSPVSNNITNGPSSNTSFASVHVPAPAALEPRMLLKRCCDGRTSWCGTSKSCYKDIRLKIRNLSMFKLSRFRQVSEQSLYRSVLICNTLKRIDREIEAETKELHQVATHAAQQHHSHINHTAAHHQPQYHHLHSHMQIQTSLSSHNSSNNNSNVHHHQLPQQQLQSQQPMLHHQHQDYMPMPNCGRLIGNIEYQHQQTAAQQSFHQQHHYQNERMESSPFHNSLQKGSTTPSHITNNQGSCTASVTTTLHPYDHYPFRETHTGRATPFPTQPVITLPPASTTPTSPSSFSQVQSPATLPASSTVEIAINSPTAPDADSGYADDDSARSINWSSVLSLSSQSALDPINNNDLFTILPPASPATAVPVSISSSSSTTNGVDANSSSSMAVAITGTFTTVQSPSAISLATTNNTSTIPPSATTTATFTTLSTISSATHSLTSSYVSSISSNSNSASSTWEYGFLDMEFGLGTEFTELSPSCKLSADDFGFKNSLTPVTVTRYDNELEQPAHIMVGS